MSGIFDSHCHYNDPAFSQDYDNVLKEIKESGIKYIVNVGADISSSRTCVLQAEKCDFMFASVGIHPQDADQGQNEAVIEELKQLAALPKVVAIGEAGLDYHYDEMFPVEIQKQVFIKQIKLANELNKPLIIHSRDAMEDTINILKKYHLKKGVVHCYSGSRESCKQLIRMGLYIGFTGVVTFKNARKAIESLKVVPLDRLLIETDCPYMAPEPFRGKRCDSSMLHLTAEKIAEELNVSKECIVNTTYTNGVNFYGI
jgi:TatD DNase family protein